MLSQVIKNKKAISPLLSYVLLISFLIIIAGIVYVGLKTYIPSDKTECPAGVSIAIKSINCPVSTYFPPAVELYFLYLEIENNGRFDIGGYIVNAKNQTDTFDFSKYFIEGNPLNIGRGKFGNTIIFTPTTINNPFTPESNVTNFFWNNGNITSIEITPIRFENEGDNQKFVICTDAKITSPVRCHVP